MKKHFLIFAGIEFFFCLATAFMNFLTIFLESRGFSITQVGMINTMCSIVAIIASPIGGIISDKMQSSRKGAIVCLIGTSLAYALIPVAENIKNIAVILIIGLIIIFRSFISPSQSLIDTSVIDGCNKKKTAFGKVRVWGTISYVIMSFILGLIVTEKNVTFTFYFLGLSMLPCIWLLIQLGTIVDDVTAAKSVSLRNLPFKKLFSNPYFIAYIIFCIIQYIPQMSVTNYQPYLIKEVGANMGLIGILHAYRAFFEIPVLLFADKLEEKFSYRNMIILSALCYAAQSILYRYVSSFPGILAATTFSGIASGLFIASSVKYVFTLAPKELISTAQTMVSSTAAFAGIIGNLMGTLLVENIGLRTFFFITGIMMLVGTLFYIGSFFFIKNYLKTPYKQEM
ncbi:MAG: MFS transporter [Erysipelotrichaceae bacterium]|nr:MFS transporter [Erysipelotrichaceae bacterium]